MIGDWRQFWYTLKLCSIEDTTGRIAGALQLLVQVLVDDDQGVFLLFSALIREGGHCGGEWNCPRLRRDVALSRNGCFRLLALRLRRVTSGCAGEVPDSLILWEVVAALRARLSSAMNNS